jgi:hypothetical protein
MRIHQWPLSHEIREKLFRAELVTFDLFDTIAYRPGTPREQFQVYGKLGSLLRTGIELFWRVLQKFGLVRDFKLEFLVPLFRSRISREFEFDLQQLYGRSSIVELIKDLTRNQKRILIVTNSYYSYEQIRLICDKLQIPKSIELVVSSEHGKIKSRGLLKSIFNELPRNHWHFGNDMKEDGVVSTSEFVLVRPIWDSLPFMSSIFNKKLFMNKEFFELRTVFLRIALDNESIVDDLFWFGAFFSGSLSVYIAQQIKLIASETSGNIYFLARDGYLPYKYLANDKLISVFYVPYSRSISKTSENLERLYKWISKTSSSTSLKIFFDLGWRGESASKINQMFLDKGYLILGGRWPWHKPKYENLSLFWKDHQFLKALAFRRFPELYELALSAPHASLLELPEEFDSWPRNFDRDIIQESITNGAIVFQNEWRGMGNRILSRKGAFLLLQQQIRNPSNHLLHMLEKVLHDSKYGPLPLVSITNQPIVFWLRGSLQVQKRVGISYDKRVVFTVREVIRRLKSGSKRFGGLDELPR